MWMLAFLLLPLMGIAYVGWHVWTLVPLPSVWRVALIAVGVVSFLLIFANYLPVRMGGTSKRLEIEK